LNDQAQPLLHDFAFYTLNAIPEGELAKVAPRATTTPVIASAKETKTTVKKEMPKAAKEMVDSKQVALLLKKYTCSACHNESTKLVGPAFTEVAKRNYTNEQILELVYKPKPENWPDFATEMAPMSHVPKADVLKIAAWINSLGVKKSKTDLNKIENHD
jgi:cytochrome c551/c552